MKLVRVAALCAVLPTVGLRAQIGTFSNIGPSKGEVAGALVGVAAAGAGIGVGIYFLVRHHAHLTGCVASDANGIFLQSEGDGHRYELVGGGGAIKPGDKVKVSGKKIGRAGNGDQVFRVEGLPKPLGQCQIAPSTP